MADRSHLVRTPIVDARGRKTIVYRKGAASPQQASAAIPQAAAPHLDATMSAAAYALSLRRIAARNAQFRRGGLYSTDDAREQGDRAGAAFDERFGTPTASYLDEDIAFTRDRIDEARSDCEYARIALGVQFAPVHAAAASEACGSGESTDPTAYHPTDVYVVMGVVRTLQELDLLEHAALPDPAGMRRLAAQVRADAFATFNYVRRTTEENDACIRLIDERPEDVDEISRLFKDGLHAEGIRALLDGDVAAPLAEGAI